jgi:hypothetical protein
MATRVSSFSLSDGNGTFHIVMKLMTSSKGKQEVATMGCCFKKCGMTGVYLPTQVAMDPHHALHDVASCASVKSKYGELFFYPFFSKSAFISPFFTFWQIFAIKKTLILVQGTHNYKKKQNK